VQWSMEEVRGLKGLEHKVHHTGERIETPFNLIPKKVTEPERKKNSEERKEATTRPVFFKMGRNHQ